MATATAIAIRKAEAQERIAKAAAAIGKAVGVEAGDLAPRHKDLMIEPAVQAEAVADFLESVADRLTAKAKPEADKPKAEVPAKQDAPQAPEKPANAKGSK